MAGRQPDAGDRGHTIPPVDWPSYMDYRLLAAAIIGLLVLFVAQRIFARLQGNFAQEI